MKKKQLKKWFFGLWSSNFLKKTQIKRTEEEKNDFWKKLNNFENPNS